MMCLLAISMVGCGSAIYSFRINAAISRLEEAKTVGAEKSAPYEYYSSEVRLAEARRQAARAEYGAAIRLAKEAEGFAGKAIVKTQNSPKNQGREHDANHGAQEPSHQSPKQQEQQQSSPQRPAEKQSLLDHPHEQQNSREKEQP